MNNISFSDEKGLNQLDQMAPEGAGNCANEWLSPMLYDEPVFTG
jgi:hypothetical protein